MVLRVVGRTLIALASLLVLDGLREGVLGRDETVAACDCSLRLRSRTGQANAGSYIKARPFDSAVNSNRLSIDNCPKKEHLLDSYLAKGLKTWEFQHSN